MSELREAIARAIYKAHLMFDPQFCEMCEQDQQAEIDLGWEFSGAEADAALAAIEARGMVVVPVVPLPVERERVEAIAKRWLADPDIRRKIAADRAMIAAARTED